MKVLYFNILFLIPIFCNVAETCLQTCARLFGDENLELDAFSKTDSAVLKIIFEYSKKNEISEIKYEKYKYEYINDSTIKIYKRVYEKEENFKKIVENQINRNENKAVLNLFGFSEEENKINVKQNDGKWVDINDFKEDLKEEEQKIEIKEDKTSLRTKIEKQLHLEFLDPGNHGIYILKIDFADNTNAYLFIDYKITIGENHGYFYKIQNMFVKQNNQEYFNEISKNSDIIKSNDGSHNEFKIFLY